MLIEQKQTAFLAQDLVLRQASKIHLPPTSGKLHFDEHVIFEPGARLHAQHIAEHQKMFIGVESYINPASYVRGAAFIGRFCSIGRRVSLGAASHNFSGLSTCNALMCLEGAEASPHQSQQPLNVPVHGSVVVGNDVWIGDGVIVKAGIEIGHGAVVGANAVVTHNVPPYAIVAGTPARILRYRFQPEIIQALLQSQWWNIERTFLNALPKHDVESFIKQLNSVPADDIPLADYPNYVFSSEKKEC